MLSFAGLSPAAASDELLWASVSPETPSICAQRGGNAHLKDRLSQCSRSQLISADPHAQRLLGQFLNGSGVRALAASDNCTCINAVAGQEDVCGAVDSAIDGCSHCGCRLVDVSESLVSDQQSPVGTDIDLAAMAGTNDLTSAFERSAATVPSFFNSPALPYFCSRDGSHAELKDRTSKCRWTTLHAQYPELHAAFVGAGREAKAVAASDDCRCAVVVFDQYGVCEAVDKAIKDCSNSGNCSCRVVDVSPSTCLVPEPPPRERNWSRKRRQQQEAYGTITYGSSWQQGEADILPEACPAGRYVIATDPCGVQHRNQGVGSITNTLKLQVEAAVRLNATFIYNPASLCIDRNRAGYSLGELFSLRGAPCSAAALHEASTSRRWPLLNLTLAPAGHHLPPQGGELDQNSESWLQESVKAAQAALDTLPSGSPAVITATGCPWVRSWRAPLVSSATGEFFRAPLRKEHENKDAWSGDLPSSQRDERPVVCVHYRYGDMGALMKSLPEGATVGGEAGQFYISNINETVAVLRRAFKLVPSLAQARLMLFSEGMPTDPPFVEFKEAFPAAELVLEDTSGSTYAPDNSTLRDIRFMAAADLLVVTCGTFSTLLTVLHFRGVTLQHPCTAQTLPRDSPSAVNFLDFAVEDGGFDEDAFLRMWDRSRSSRAARAQEANVTR